MTYIFIMPTDMNGGNTPRKYKKRFFNLQPFKFKVSLKVKGECITSRISLFEKGGEMIVLLLTIVQTI